MIYVAGYLPSSTVNGEGIRKVLFVSGCSIRCEGCHNKDLWDKELGEQVTVEELYEFITKDTNIKKLTLSGGEPFDQAKALSELVKLLKKDEYDVISFSGYTIKEISKDINKRVLLEQLDGLIDGRYIEGQIIGKYKYAGSSNQRYYNKEQIRRYLDG